MRQKTPAVVAITTRQRVQERSHQATVGGGGRRLDVAIAPAPESACGQLSLEPRASGVLIQQVEPNSPPTMTGLRPGDVIVSADNKPVNAPSDVANARAETQKQK